MLKRSGQEEIKAKFEDSRPAWPNTGNKLG